VTSKKGADAQIHVVSNGSYEDGFLSAGSHGALSSAFGFQPYTIAPSGSANGRTSSIIISSSVACSFPGTERLFFYPSVRFLCTTNNVMIADSELCHALLV
jgi:hypothetical protein